jgi:hypothetical protein
MNEHETRMQALGLNRIVDQQVREILAERQRIAVIWGIDDVQLLRPDLDNEQAWEVLQDVASGQDRDHGITNDSLVIAAWEKFPVEVIWPPPGDAEVTVSITESILNDPNAFLPPDQPQNGKDRGRER